MPGSMSAAIKRRQLRHLGNKAKIPSGHPDGNKSTMKPGTYGRAASSQQASGGGGPDYMAGAPAPSHNIHVSVAMPSNPTGYATAPGMDMEENKKRLRTPPGNELPAAFSKGAMKRRARGK